MQDTYESFHYTSLLYLNTYEKDYKGGRFIFIDGSNGNLTKTAIEPKKARVSAFTSGAENLHHVEQVAEGERYFLVFWSYNHFLNNFVFYFCIYVLDMPLRFHLLVILIRRYPTSTLRNPIYKIKVVNKLRLENENVGNVTNYTYILIS